MWDELLQWFRVETGPQDYELKTAIMSCKQKGTSVATYFSKLKKLWDKLANYDHVSVFDCEKTTTELEKHQEKGKLLQFLFG